MSLDFPALDPVLLDLPGPIDIRWYGLMYIAGFAVAHVLIGKLADQGFLKLDRQAAQDLLVWMLFGVILGGRLGYAVFYDNGLADPLKILQIWKGGMSFHGGLIGVFVAFLLYARKYKIAWLRLGDAAALVVTPGILFVRMANFINGELYGRVTEAGVFGAMRFPTDPDATRALGLGSISDTRSKELAIQVAFGNREFGDVQDQLATHYAANGFPIPWSSIAEKLDWSVAQESVPFRHPSQLYEGLAEGLLLGLVIWALYLLLRKGRHLGPGGYGGLFLLGYGTARWFIELLRQPDTQFTSADDPIGTVFMGMTMGQTLCSAMIAAGLVFFVRGLLNREPAQ